MQNTGEFRAFSHITLLKSEHNFIEPFRADLKTSRRPRENWFLLQKHPHSATISLQWATANSLNPGNDENNSKCRHSDLCDRNDCLPWHESGRVGMFLQQEH